jgi:hypothetical protein
LSTGYIGGTGLRLHYAAAVANYGDLIGDNLSSSSNNGISAYAGATIKNGNATQTAQIIDGYSGIFATHAPVTITNFARIYGLGPAGDGVFIVAGGVVTNGADGDTVALIAGQNSGVAAGALATVVNFGTIEGIASQGVNLGVGGAVFNGSATNATAEIYGQAGAGVLASKASTKITNFGSIVSYRGDGVYLADGGTVINGASGDTIAFITGARGAGVVAEGAAATVANFATIRGGSHAGVALGAGGVVTNGAADDTAATIYGKDLGVWITGGAGTVTNFGDLASGVGVFGYGVLLDDGGRVVNGSAADTTAAIYGLVGVKIDAAPATVINYGTVASNSGYAVSAVDAATIVNGSNADRSAVLLGAVGVDAGGGTLRNFGTVTGSLGMAAINVGLLVNGSAGDLTALIQGALLSSTGGVVTNFATITGGADPAVHLDSGRLTNGSATITSALISGGATGVDAVNGATIDNFGVIYGGGGVAVDMTGANNVLEVEAGCVFYGVVLGGGGTLDLAGGSGTITGFTHGDATVSGAVTPAAFANFGAFEIAAPASFTLAGAGAVTTGRTLLVNGHLTLAGALSSAGSLIVARTMSGSGTLSLTAGTATFQPGAALTVAKVTQSGGVASFTAASLTVSHPWIQTAGTVTVGAGDRVNFSGAGDSFSGTLSGAGVIGFTGGSDTLLHPTLAATSMVVNGAAVTLSGNVRLSGALAVASPNLAIATAGATLSAGGSLNLTNQASNAIKGVAATATLTNLDKITGAGTLSSLVLVNQAGGIINGNVSTTLIINTGTVAVTNGGVIESTSTGGVTIKSAVANAGTLSVTKGVLDVTGAVSGAGVVRIGGGTADFGSTFTENVTFTSTTGVLELAKATAYAGTITGFSKTGTTSLDLLDIGFTSGVTKATYSGTTASGVLTVTDGTHTAKIHFAGNYTASAWTVSSDGHGGTKVVDPTAPAGHAPPLAPLIAAMAGFGAKSAEAALTRAFAAHPQAALLVHAA